jgi:hypothetical protein
VANLKVYIVRTAKIDGKWKYLAPVVSDKGRMSPDFVLLNGDSESGPFKRVNQQMFSEQREFIRFGYVQTTA